MTPSITASQNSGTATLHTYDLFNQLTQTVKGTDTTDFTYRPDGLRTSKKVGSTTTTHYWDGSQMALESVGSTYTKYIRGINLIASAGSSTNYHLYNAHGDVVQLTNSSGTVTKTYDYDAFGVEVSPTASDTNPFRYAGEYYDKETGTYYLRARYYSPGLGRFLSEDTYRGNASDPLSLHLYTYCHNNPVMWIDPSGHAKLHWNGSYYTYQANNKTMDAFNAFMGAIPIVGLGVLLGKAITGLTMPKDVNLNNFDVASFVGASETASNILRQGVKVLEKAGVLGGTVSNVLYFVKPILGTAEGVLILLDSSYEVQRAVELSGLVGWEHKGQEDRHHIADRN